MTLSYLVSTAGHAREQNDLHPHNVRHILQLIQEGAEDFGDEKVVGFASPSKDGLWTCDRYSFSQLWSLASSVKAQLIASGIPTTINENETLALLCPTGLDFLLCWIASMMLGYGVLFVAPQCSPNAIAGLSESTLATHLVAHSKYLDLAQSALSIKESKVKIVQLGKFERSSSPVRISVFEHAEGTTVSHVFHTSGTSGTPKPIYHTHGGSLRVLPRRGLPSYIRESATSLPPSEPAAFTTTPLFHGGVSDLLRAWMARSMIYFYPTSDVSITQENIIRAIDACQAPPPQLRGAQLSVNQRQERIRRFRINSFLSVPYILTVLAEDPNGPGMKLLKSMDYVSTGGAPLNPALGDSMVDAGVRLVSRLGSSECGFLLSSHRDYDTEKDWNWLRNDSADADVLIFERDNGDPDKYQLVVTDRWTSKTKSNRPDGSYATGDLYERHPTKANCWRYAGRSDDVIVMSNGEKASPGPIEDVFRSSTHFSDALVVGADQAQLGLLLFPKEGQLANTSDMLSSLVTLANKSSPTFAQVSVNMCRVVENSDKSLPKSSKGTVQRGVAYEVFREEIERLYEGDVSQKEPPKRNLETIKEVITQIIIAQSTKGLSLDPATDLFNWGVNSLVAIKIRNAITATLNIGGVKLPTNIVFEQPTVDRLSKYVHGLQEGKSSTPAVADDAQSVMQELVAKYGVFEQTKVANERGPSRSRGRIVVLTGATGFLGGLLLSELCDRSLTEIHKVICLVRDETDQDAGTRLQRVLDQRGLCIDKSRYEVYLSDLKQSDLGLVSSVYRFLADEADTVIHAAWPVHFGTHLTSFEDSIKGTRNLIDLVAKPQSRATMYFCSSLASILSQLSSRIQEEPSIDPHTAGSIGYSQSKWVTEQICQRARQADIAVHVLRVGQLCGDTSQGRWNEREGWPLLIRTSQTTSCLPVLIEKPSWLPVDVAARAILEVVTNDQPDRPFIYHIVHPLGIQWNALLDWLQLAGLAFRKVDPIEWLQKVEETPEEDPSRQMLWLWREAYGGTKQVEKDMTIETENASNYSEAIRTIKPVSSGIILKMVQAWRTTGFL